MENNKRALLCILDGWGISKDEKYNAISKGNTPNFDKFVKTMPHTQIHADGNNVGLPKGQMGNSEVGHLNIGAGRIVYQELTRINKQIEEGEFFKNEEFLNAINHVKKYNSSLHIYGLVSTGGVHSSIEHLKALIKMAAQNGLKDVYVHAFLDGRDTPPQSAKEFLEEIEKTLKEYNLPPIASVIGRYWVMDRDKRWERVERAYNALLLGEGNKADTAVEGLEESYKNGKNDEFVEPIVVGGRRIENNDAVIFFNYRPDRAREITSAIALKDFKGFERKAVRDNIYYVCMTQYDETFPLPVAFKPEKLTNILGQVLDDNNVKEFRTAETEKYAHITFFFNGGEEVPFKLETRKLVASPKVATYDLKPEMSAYEVCDKLCETITSGKYDVIIINFANPDMVGHTGVEEAAIKAIEAVDECVGRAVDALKSVDGQMFICADHGNAEQLKDYETGDPFTAHTTNPVPFILVNADPSYKLREGGCLADIVPTLLELMGMEQPAEMTGKSLLIK